MIQLTQPIENRRGDRRKPESNSLEFDGIKQKPLFRPSGRMCVNCQHVNRDCSHLDFSTMQVIARDSTDKSSGIITQVVKCSEHVRTK